MAYPQSQLQDCIASAKENAGLKGKNPSQESLEGYCDCALKLIVDEKSDLRRSGYQCALRFFK